MGGQRVRRLRVLRSMPSRPYWGAHFRDCRPAASQALPPDAGAPRAAPRKRSAALAPWVQARESTHADEAECEPRASNAPKKIKMIDWGDPPRRRAGEQMGRATTQGRGDGMPQGPVRGGTSAG